MLGMLGAAVSFQCLRVPCVQLPHSALSSDHSNYAG